LNAKGVGSFKWDPNTLTNNPLIYNPVVTPLATTSFIVTLTDQYGCKNVDTVMVGVTENPIADAGPDQELDYLLETTMNATLANVIETGNWSLVTGTGTISDASYPKTSISGLSLGMNKFLWTVTNKVCPSSSDTVNIFVSDFFIPTLITPNLDGKNDNFVLKGLSTLGKTELVIFDRRGVRVYQNSDYDNSWDGVDYNNNPLPDDTYFYVLKSNIGKSMSGYIVIRR
jgi:gliding motility-associated-like protein